MNTVQFYDVTLRKLPASIVERLVTIFEAEKAGLLYYDKNSNAYWARNSHGQAMIPISKVDLPETNGSYVKLFLHRAIAPVYRLAMREIDTAQDTAFEAMIVGDEDGITIDIEPNPASAAGQETIEPSAGE